MPMAPMLSCPCGGRRHAGQSCNRCGNGGPAARREAQRQHDAKRGSARERGYTAQWDEFSKQFLAEHPLCAGPYSLCEEQGIVSAAEVTDHREPHRGDMVKFWAGPFDPLCARCHNSKTGKGL